MAKTKHPPGALMTLGNMRVLDLWMIRLRSMQSDRQDSLAVDVSRAANLNCRTPTTQSKHYEESCHVRQGDMPTLSKPDYH